MKLIRQFTYRVEGGSQNAVMTSAMMDVTSHGYDPTLIRVGLKGTSREFIAGVPIRHDPSIPPFTIIVEAWREV